MAVELLMIISSSRRTTEAAAYLDDAAADGVYLRDILGAAHPSAAEKTEGTGSTGEGIKSE